MSVTVNNGVPEPSSIESFDPVKALKSVLCDAKGRVCAVVGSEEDAKKVQEALRVLSERFELEKPAQFKEGCFGIRSEIELIKSFVVNWMKHPELKEMVYTEAVLDKKTEIYSNLKLAFRHLEDSRMRIGKALQAYDEGKSCYPK